MGGDLRMFLDLHAFIVIFGGATAATLIRFPLSSHLPRPADGHEVRLHDAPLDRRANWSTRSRGSPRSPASRARSGSKRRTSKTRSWPRACASSPTATTPTFIRDNLERDRDNFLTHLDEGQKIYRAIGDCAPAFGMIGTLIGMVQMFANMTDPSKLGPYMAVALLATFYGAAVANLFCLPIADKLQLKLHDEDINRTLIIDGVLMIRDAKSPTLVREMLLAYLPEKHRHAEADDDEAAEPAAA